MVHLELIYLWKMGIFQSYVRLPDGNPAVSDLTSRYRGFDPIVLPSA